MMGGKEGWEGREGKGKEGRPAAFFFLFDMHGSVVRCKMYERVVI